MDPEDLDHENEGELVVEAEELADLIKKVIDSSGDAAGSVYSRYRNILYKYQEQSQLLDAYLEGIVHPLSALLREQAMALNADSSAATPLARVLGICRLLSVLVTVRGYKTVVRFFPHEAADLEAVLHVIHVVRDYKPGSNSGGSTAGSSVLGADEEGLAIWEAQAVLLLWLSILILIPFELATVDTEAVLQPGAARSQPYTILVARILDLCKGYLQHPGTVREMAALLLGRLLVRPDQGPALREFLVWSRESLLSPQDTLAASFLVPGTLQTLCFVFKLGQRERLLPHASAVWAQLQELRGSTGASGSAAAAGGAGGVLARKLCVKLAQRVCLTFLEPRLAPWRYCRADAGSDLDARLGGAGGGPGANPLTPAAGNKQQPVPGSGGDGGEDGEEEFEIAEEVEDIITALLEALRDKDTVVRWSGAKGIGRVTGCLPAELGDEVVGSVLDLFRPTESDTAWHGGCLALAELARRGLLLPPRLPGLVPIIQKALLYDVRKGAHSIGAHVRDAAAYVCWAFARAYEPELLAPHVEVLASTLLTVACYDREVNCRRAAAAAFQEAVGRLGNFPHGIELLTVADYFMVGNLKQAYLKVAPAVGAYPEYRLPLATHLVHTQLRHWEKSLRHLAAAGLAGLVPVLGGTYLATEALDLLLPWCLDAVLEVRHGAVLGIAALLPALVRSGVAITQERLEQIAGLVPAIDKARLYRGKGGEVMREAVSRLVGACADVGLPCLTPGQHLKMCEALDENLRNPQATIQSSAVDAVGRYARAFACTPEEVARFSRYLGSYLSRLHDPNVAVRRGYARALGAMPLSLVGPRAQEVVEALVDGTVLEEDPDERDVESRAHCVVSLGRVCETLMGRLPPLTTPPTSTSGEAAEKAGESGSAPAEDGVEGALGSSEAESPTESAASGAQAPTQESRQAGVRLIVDKVLPCLLSGLEDYTTDPRGDVGSWVREAAMDVGTKLVTLLALHAPDAAQVLPGAAPQIVAALLKQAVERIARMREAAVVRLRALLGATWAPPLVAACVPGSPLILGALPVDSADLAGVVSLEVVRRVAALISCLPLPYTGPLLEGLVASIGCVDAQLAKAASAALVDLLTQSERQQQGAATTSAANGGSDAAGPGQPASGTQQESLAITLGSHLVTLWQRHAKSPRMSAPLLRTADLLVTRAPQVLSAPVPPLPPKQPAGAEAAGPAQGTRSALVPLADVLVELARAETRQCSDVGRLLAAATLLAHLLPCPNPARTSAYQGLLVLLVSKYPKVRRHAAEQMYLSLLPLEPSETGGPEGGVTQAAAESAQEVLVGTLWDGDLEGARAARDAVAQHLQVKVPAMKAPATGSGAGKKGAKDEYASYQALLDDFARAL